MRLLHVCESFSPVSETFIYDLIMELERQGIDNHVLAFERQDAEGRPFSKVTIARRAERYHPLRILLRGWHARHPGGALEAAWRIERPRLRRALLRMRPDLVHAHFGPTGALVAPVAREVGVKCITSFHGFDVTSVPREAFWKKKYESLWSQAALLTGVSGHICGLLEAQGASRRKIARISNGISLQKFPFNPPGSRFDGKNIRCLFVGRLVEKKGPLLLLQAFARARKTVNGKINLTLQIAGDGPLMSQLKRERQAHDLTGCVEILGQQSHDEVRRLLQQAHILLQHSVTASDGDQEGQGVTLIEASAVGLPVIATRHDGIPEVVLDGKTGFLVEEFDVEAMAQRLADLAMAPGTWEELGRNGRKHVEQNMRLEVQVEAWRNVYQRVLHSDPIDLDKS